jgi:hypothetical protein
MLRIFLFVLALVVPLIIGRVTFGEFNTIVCVSVGAAGFAASKLILSNLMPVGHGVNGKRHFLGMPLLLFSGYFLILAFILPLVFIQGPNLLPLTIANCRVLGIALLSGWTAALIDWYMCSSRDTYFFSEMDHRRILKARGHSEDVVEKNLDDIRAK